ncbi:MAG: 3-deoxy-manno-octulosonate cytidylyltransferase [Thermoanaerobaculia bacterium]|nr:3-deoxy-manno-octulosonate cytidylyltransferase [Thermoanaerobaculia bacterium]
MHPSGTSPSTESEASIVAAIPARYGSERFPGKVLADLDGRPLVEHVYRRAEQAEGIAGVVVLTDDDRIAAAVDAFGGQWQMTPADCASGTDRIAWAAREWTANAIVNVQGDEPLIDPGAIAAVARHLARRPDDAVVTLASPAEPADADDPNVVKVVVDAGGYALYFSRAAIPYRRRAEGAAARRHQGIYGYQRSALIEIAALAPSPLERTEALEQLRMLENGYRLRVLDWPRPSPGVDTAEDLERVRELLASDRTS